MSSNLRISKICEYCNNDFIAKKTTSKTCSDSCAKRLYKLKQRNNIITQVTKETEIKRKLQKNRIVKESDTIHKKEFLTLMEGAVLLNISPLTLRRWILTGKIISFKIGKKHISTVKALS